jgi:hypothetical protein
VFLGVKTGEPDRFEPRVRHLAVGLVPGKVAIIP